jgi:hypothetical protein
MYPNDGVNFMNLGKDSDDQDSLTSKAMTETCSQECSQRDCNQVLFLPKFELSGEEEKASCLKSQISFDPLVKAETIEQVEFIQFLTETTSTFGFWFGLSIVGAIQLCGQLVNRAIRKFKSNERRIHPVNRNVSNLIQNQLLEMKCFLHLMDNTRRQENQVLKHQIAELKSSLAVVMQFHKKLNSETRILSDRFEGFSHPRTQSSQFDQLRG